MTVAESSLGPSPARGRAGTGAVFARIERRAWAKKDRAVSLRPNAAPKSGWESMPAATGVFRRIRPLEGMI